MTLPSHTADRATPPALAALFAEYLNGQAAAQADGLGFAEPRGEVEPYESAPVRPVDPALAWDDAVAAAVYYTVVKLKGTPPPDWSALVSAREPAVSLAFALGNFPQLVRDLHPLLGGGDLTALRADVTVGAAAPGLTEWARTAPAHPQALLAAGVLRLARRFDEAEELLKREPPPAAWQAAQANEEAALAWHRGRAEEAAALWRRQPDSTPVLFNRGMAALFLGDADAAHTALSAAAAALPETGAWHHLARLYLALAAARH